MTFGGFFQLPFTVFEPSLGAYWPTYAADASVPCIPRMAAYCIIYVTLPFQSATREYGVQRDYSAQYAVYDASQRVHEDETQTYYCP